jgi:hypothetical protein
VSPAANVAAPGEKISRPEAHPPFELGLKVKK